VGSSSSSSSSLDPSYTTTTGARSQRSIKSNEDKEMQIGVGPDGKFDE
jgi:hypothetical protein